MEKVQWEPAPSEVYQGGKGDHGVGASLMSDELKFGPAPETNALYYLLLHFVCCLTVLVVVRPPLVVNDLGRLRILLVLLVAASLTWVVGAATR